jgi:cytochrome c553
VTARACLALLAAAVAAAARAADPTPADLEFFEKRVRPVLVEHCVSCHGDKKQKGGLRLDSRAAALAGGDVGPAVVPGKPDDSPLVKAVRYTDDLQMPPKGKLPDAAVADLAEWVKRGAPWPGDAGAAARVEGGFTDAMKRHWAFQPVRKPPTPKGDAHPIDTFLRAKIDAAGLTPTRPADARTFARRLAFDLTGLPPVPDRVAAFEKAYAADPDSAVKAYVAELLASPRYGERWGRHWLDVARYADSNGSEVDHAMANAWRYRDYVIAAFNADKPFDSFVREQVAGDLLGTPDGLLASGFLMLGPKALAELDKEVFRYDVADEQVDTIGKAFVGLTFGCARCHDHKFDPISAKDYYALAGILRSSNTVDTSKRVATWTERPLPNADPVRAAELTKKAADLRAERAKVAANAKAGTPKLAAGAKYLLVEAEDFATANVRVDRENLGKGIGVVRTRMEYPDSIEYAFELPAAGEYQVELRYAAKESRPTHLLVNGNLEDMDAAAAVTGDWFPKNQKWHVEGKFTFKAGRNTLAFRRDGPVPLFDKWLVGTVLADGKKHSDALKDPTPAKAPPDDATAKKLKDLDAAIAAADAEREKVPTALAPLDGPGKDLPVLVRGNPAMPGPVVPRGFPTFFEEVKVAAPGASQSGRKELADWLTHPANPLTARVIVNRVWGWHFGDGLVRSPDNFGLRGETPSHPELLDWLAARFVENGWSVKKLNALICTSAAYRRAVGPPADADPENRLLARWPRQRLDAEQVRDAMLAVGGNLDPAAGGSLMEVLNRTYATGGNAPPDVVKRMHYDAPRRSVYLPVVRNAVYDLFAAFDYPEPGTVTGRRDATTVAPQALFLINSPFVRDQGRRLAERVRGLGKDDGERVRAAYELVFSRTPTGAEMKAAAAFLDRDEAALKGSGEKNPRAAAWARLCHALLASNEFLYVR